MKRSFCMVFLTLIGSTALAQAPEERPTPALSTGTGSQAAPLTRTSQAVPAGEEAFLAPLATHPADPVGGAYGLWAGAWSWKASFHDGFAFYPFRGAGAPATVGVRWKTERVAIGDKELLHGASEPEIQSAEWRCEFRYPGLVEAYDLSAKGVEQSFVIASRPAGHGDLVVRGRIETLLRAEARAPRHGELLYRDERGEAVVSYGAAIAFDAAGRKVDVLTGFEGDTLELVVPGAWIEDAVFPVTIDPLTAAVTVSTWGATSFGLSSYSAIGRDDENTTKNIMVFYSRQFSATDFDAYSRLCDNDFSNSGIVFNDITTSWSTVRAGVASVAGANRWTLCLQRDFTSSGYSGVRVYVHDFANTTLNSGTTLFHSIPSGETHRYPEVGGTTGYSSGNNALLVYQADITATQQNTPNSEAWGVLVDAAAGTFGTRFLLAGTGVGTSLDREFPVVNQESAGGASSWIVAWQQFDNTITNDDWDIISNRVAPTGTVSSLMYQGPATSTPAHKVRPRVAGSNGRYLVSYTMTTALASEFGSSIDVARFDWPDSASAPTKIAIRSVASGGTADYVNGAIAYDDLTDSHWGIVYQRGGYTASDLFAARVGYTGGLTERATVYAQASTGGYSANVAFDNDAQTFMIVYGTTENPPSGYPVYGTTFTYPSTASNVLYGTACKGTIGANRRPFAGSQFYGITLSGAGASSAALLLCSVGSTSQSLGFAGLTGCFLHVNPIVVSLGTTTSASGAASMTFALPDAPLVIGDVYWQWLFLDSSVAWPTKAATTRGLRSQIR